MCTITINSPDPATPSTLEVNPDGLHVEEDSLAASVPRGAGVLKEGLGVYGARNAQKMIAEAFAKWRLSARPRPIAAAIGAFIDKHFKGK
ncbi:hypothetical protein Acsp03_47330 [Actinomadura sp. NBRC 104412]|nr:hypothetical protein Acsp03_47330 [Actinomadura sp. NBRC 104412]